MRLILVRHGETESNRQNLALGRSDVPMNENGLRQAEALARALATEDIAAIYASPLDRTRQTADAIALLHDGLGVAVEERLIEMDVGEIEGLPFTEIREAHPGVLERWMSKDGPQHPMPGGERLADVSERAWSAVSEIAERRADDTVVAVTHNFVILTLLARVAGIDLSEFRRLRHSLAAVSRVEIGPDRAQILSLNDTCHLADVDNP